MLKWILPVWSESGDSGRDRVGDGVPTPRLFLLLLRQLEHKQGKRGKKLTGCELQRTPLISICYHNLYKNVSVGVSMLRVACYNITVQFNQ